jgi:hypothetical protein
VVHGNIQFSRSTCFDLKCGFAARFQSDSAFSEVATTPRMQELMEGVAQCRIDGGNTHYIC